MLTRTLGSEAFADLQSRYAPDTTIKLRNRQGWPELTIYGVSVASAFDEVVELLLAYAPTLLDEVRFKPFVIIGCDDSDSPPPNNIRELIEGQHSVVEACPPSPMTAIVPLVPSPGAFPSHLISLVTGIATSMDTRNLQHIDVDAMITTMCEKCLVCPEDLTVDGFRIAFCTATIKRNYQTKVALPMVLLACWPFRHMLKVFVADYNSDDDLFDYVGQHLHEAFHIGLLEYRRCSSIHYWDASVCKNGIHFEAIRCGATAVMNLDTDRVFPQSLPAQVCRAFVRGHAIVWAACNWVKGSTGTIAAKSMIFQQVNGYDEAFKPSGCQDIDLLLRMERSSGEKKLLIKDTSVIGGTLSNAPREQSDNTAIQVCNVDPSKWEKWGKMDSDNRALMNENLKNHKYVANARPGWKPIVVDKPCFRQWQQRSGGPWVTLADPNLQLQQITLFTCGYKKMAEHYPHAAQAWRAIRSSMDQDQVKTALSLSEIEVSLALGTQPFMQFHPHLGFHRDALADFMRPEARDHRHRIFQQVHAAIRGASSQHLAIACCCESGRHASVALSVVLRYVIRKLEMPGLAINLEHLCSWHWKYAICQVRARQDNLLFCHPCHSTRLDEVRKGLLMRAVEEYTEAMQR